MLDESSFDAEDNLNRPSILSGLNHPVNGKKIIIKQCIRINTLVSTSNHIEARATGSYERSTKGELKWRGSDKSKSVAETGGGQQNYRFFFKQEHQTHRALV